MVSTDGRNSTALCFAILNEQLDTVAVLLEHGVDVNLGARLPPPPRPPLTGGPERYSGATQPP